MRVTTFCGPAIIAALAISCSDSTTPPPVPAALQIVSGDGQQGTVGAELSQPVVVRVLDGDTKPMAGLQVDFVITGGGGALSSATGLTNADGVAEDRWTLGTSTAEPQTLQARVAVDESRGLLLVARFTATPHSAAPDTIRVVSGDGQTVVARTPAADSLLAIVVDRYGNPVPGVVVAWSVSANGGTLSRTTDTTSVTGHTSTKFTAGSQTGDYQVVAAVGQLAANFAIHVSPPPLTLNDLVGRHALDSLLGQPMPGYFVQGERLIQIFSGDLEILPNGTGVLTEAFSSKNCIILSSCGHFAAVDVRSVPVSLNGNVLHFGTDTGTVTATEIGLYGSYGFFTARRAYRRASIPTGLPAAGPATALVKVSGDAQQAKVGTALTNPLVVRAVDASGQPVAGQQVRFEIRIGIDGFVNGTPVRFDVITDANGLAQVVWTLGTYTDDPQVLTAAVVSSAEGVPPAIVQFSATATP